MKKAAPLCGFLFVSLLDIRKMKNDAFRKTGRALKDMLRDPGFIFPLTQTTAYTSQIVLNSVSGAGPVLLLAAALANTGIAGGVNFYRHFQPDKKKSSLSEHLHRDTVTYKANGYWQWFVLIPLALATGNYGVAGMSFGFGSVMSIKGCLELNNHETHPWDLPERGLKAIKRGFERLGNHPKGWVAKPSKWAGRLLMGSEFWAGVGLLFFASAAGMPWALTLPTVAVCTALSVAHDPSRTKPAYRRTITALFNKASDLTGKDITGPAGNLHRKLYRTISRKREPGHVSDMTLARGVFQVFGVATFACIGGMLAAATTPIAAASAGMMMFGQGLAIWASYNVMRHMHRQDQADYKHAVGNAIKEAHRPVDCAEKKSEPGPLPQAKPRSMNPSLAHVTKAFAKTEAYHRPADPQVALPLMREVPSCQSGPR